MLREPVKSYDKTKFEVEVPEGHLIWTLRMTEGQEAELTNKLKKKIEARHDWIHILYEYVWRNMKYKMPKLERFSPNMLNSTDEILIAFCEAIKKHTGLDKIKPKQTKLKTP